MQILDRGIHESSEAEESLQIQEEMEAEVTNVGNGAGNTLHTSWRSGVRRKSYSRSLAGGRRTERITQQADLQEPENVERTTEDENKGRETAGK